MQRLDYYDENVVLEASYKGSGPTVVICHTWSGKDGWIEEVVEKIASWGYLGFALDIYGKGIVGKSPEENLALKTPFLQDRKLLQRRLLKGLEVAKSVGKSSPMAALDLARSDPNLKGAVAVYSHFEEAENVPNSNIRASILLLHGALDPVVPITQLDAFTKALSALNMDWQTHIFSNTLHSFMNPQVNAPAKGLQYNPVSAKRTFNAIEGFLGSIV